MNDPVAWKSALNSKRSDEEVRVKLKVAEAKAQVYESLNKVSGYEIQDYTPSKGDAIVVVQASDWHVEESITLSDVPGVINVYNPEVARKRSEQFAQRIVVLADSLKCLNISQLVLHLGGDFITGHLHDDNKESNHMHPLQASMFAEELLISVLRYLQKRFKNIVVVGTVGNHGRLSMKPRSNTLIQTNIEWLLYCHLAKQFPGIQWNIAEGYHVYLKIWDFVCRFHHGDHVHYQGGIGGVDIPLRKAIAAWNRVKRADYDFIGHWHQLRDGGDFVINGSLCGYNAYALMAKCPYEAPAQSFTVIDRKRGKSIFARIWTDYLPEDVTK